MKLKEIINRILKRNKKAVIIKPRNKYQDAKLQYEYQKMQDLIQRENQTFETYQKVNRYTKASKKHGKIIFCPKCKSQTIVYHFSWSAITCNQCENMIDKYKWLIKKINQND